LIFEEVVCNSNHLVSIRAVNKAFRSKRLSLVMALALGVVPSLLSCDVVNRCHSPCPPTKFLSAKAPSHFYQSFAVKYLLPLPLLLILKYSNVEKAETSALLNLCFFKFVSCIDLGFCRVGVTVRNFLPDRSGSIR
jgi:hypothetical protein